jgi:hypothetical protein
MPKRIQRRRTKGWRLPEGAVCVTPPGKWRNPFHSGVAIDVGMYGWPTPSLRDARSTKPAYYVPARFRK